ncbi:MAG TPA: EAL domain-containing protein [Ilumatobacteraceae bacterium]|nr:EAL domain-containing protein [Ilumatobacteraceae bacterium]
MKRALAPLTWWAIGIGYVLALAIVSIRASWLSTAAYLCSALVLVAATVVAAKVHRVNPKFIAAVGGIGSFFAASQIVDSLGDGPGFGRASDILGLCGSISIIIALIHRLSGRASASLRSVLGDALIVGLGGWLISWVAMIEPTLLNRGGSLGEAILKSAYQPVGTVVLFLLVLMMFSRSGNRQPAVWMVTVAIALNLTGDVLWGLHSAGHIGEWANVEAMAAYVAAYFTAAGAFLHPTVIWLKRASNEPATNRMFARLILTTSSLVIPVIALAATGPNDPTDGLVRSLSALVLAGAVTLRVTQSVRDNGRTQNHLRLSAQTDALTGLPNRLLLLDRINECLRIAWQSDSHPTLYFVDLDRFKNINDSLGHAAGDEVLKMVAMRLSKAAPEHSTVARLSGDEYVVLDPSTRSPGASLALAERLLSIFREPLPISQGDVFVTASIGVASLSPSSSSSAEDLLRHADTAMYRAKDAGRNCLAVYDESMHERVAHRLSVETALYRALDRRELRLFHQPILDLESGDVVGFEALMRWQQGDGTIVSPAEFIPIAEDTGTILPIGSWALLEALTQLRSWIDDGVCSESSTMSVNVSPRQLSDPNFPSIVNEALNRSGVPPQLLWLEVTESVMIAEPELALATLRRIRSLGARIALDDFGTGYSSLSLLQKFPLQRIKIDRAFVHGVADNPNDRSLVRTIVAMGRSLGLDMVAEGVESVHQLQVLSDLGCTKAQGYLISHPVPADAMRSTVAALERLGQFPGLRPASSTYSSRQV